MAKLTIVARLVAKHEHIDGLRLELTKLIAPTLGETGCLQYDLHLDNENPAHFLFYENWESPEHWQDHMKSHHIQAFRAASEGMLETFTVHQMTQIS